MIQLVRVDGRLIHGMVAVTWCGMYNPQILAVVNDAAANDEFHTMTLKLAKPGTVENCFVWTKEKAVERINSGKYDKKKMFITVATVEDAYELAKRCPAITSINIGPEVEGGDGRVTQGKQEISEGVWINEAKFQLLKELHEEGKEVFAQITTAMSKVTGEEIAAKFR